jgi:hypothetical protein
MSSSIAFSTDAKGASRRGSYRFQQQRYHLVAKCAVVLLCVTASVYCFLLRFSLDSEYLEEDQNCSIQWNYQDCRPQSQKILGHIPSPDDWVAYREAYRRAVVNNPSHFSLDSSTWKDGSASGLHVPVEVKNDPKRGRGVYATVPIPKGTLVWDNRFTARIRNECEGRRFVLELTHEQACNVIIWGYPFDHGTGHLEWGIDLDQVSFLNRGNTAAEINVEDRVVDPSKLLQPGGHSMWSIRDIAEGEELMSSYKDLHTPNPMKNLWWHVKLVYMSWGIRSVIY